MDLVIVESPAKAKTIEGFLGKGFTVKSSFGHVRDLAGKDKAIDIENGFTPHYEVMKDKTAVVKELKSLAKKSEAIDITVSPAPLTSITFLGKAGK